jgi:hypothetical protein
MPTFGSLLLAEFCWLARDIGYQTRRKQDLPRFGALDEVIPLRPACLIFIMSKIGYNGALEGLRGGVLAERQGG